MKSQGEIEMQSIVESCYDIQDIDYVNNQEWLLLSNGSNPAYPVDADTH